MARDFGEVPDVQDLNDDELRALIAERFEAEDRLDPDGIDVTVDAGRITLSGRVGTESELEAYEKVARDLVGPDAVSSELVVDELTRLEEPEAVDDAAALPQARERTSDEADHLLEDTESEQFGTESTREAIERGFSYEPPTDAGEEGTRSRERH